LADATEKGSELREALLQIAGVHSVGAMSLDEVSVLAHVTVGYDPALTNPIVFLDELGRNGFSVVSAAEEPTNEPNSGLLRYLARVDSLLAPGPCANGPHDRQGWPRASFKKLSSERLKVFLGLPALRHRQRRGAARHGMRRRTGTHGRLQPQFGRSTASAGW